MSGLRAALRIARRDAWRAKGRSALVLFMIGLPVLALTSLAVLWKTYEMSTVESLPYRLGQADARIVAATRTPVIQAPDPEQSWSQENEDGEEGKPLTDGEVGQVAVGRLGQGTRVIPVRETVVPMRTAKGQANVSVVEVDLRQSMTRGALTVAKGRAASAPDEVLISRRISERGVRIGGQVVVTHAATPKRVVGIVNNPRKPKQELIAGLPGTTKPGVPWKSKTWLVDAREPVSWAQVRQLNKAGLVVLSRDVIEHPPPESAIPARARPVDVPADPYAYAVGGLAVAMILLEIVLLAGPAFAVGLRRQRRQLALVAATGGHRGHIRAIMLGGGLVLGLTAAAVAGLAGLGVAAVVRPVLNLYLTKPFGPYEVPWSWLGATALAAVLSGLAAAFVPAVQASRMNVVTALAGRRDQARTRAGWPILGGLLIGAGCLASALSVGVLKEYGAALGASLLILGLVMVSPVLVGLAGRLAKGLPLPLRLASRDASRNRGRTAPAAAAIMATVAALTALAIAGASDSEEERREYEPMAPHGTVHVGVGEGREAEKGDRIRGAFQREVPGARPIEIRGPVCRDNAPGGRCVSLWLSGADEDSGGTAPAWGDARLARFAADRDDPAIARALADGRAVVFLPGLVRNGSAEFVVAEGEGDAKERKVTLPAIAVKPSRKLDSFTPQAVLPPSAAARLRVPVVMSGYLIDPADFTISDKQRRALTEAVAGIDEESEVYVERGYTGSFGVPLLLMAAAGLVLVLGGTFIATGLASADARPDLATLAAIGATPRTRRWFTMGQAGFVALLGTWLGVAAGFVPGLAVTWPLTTKTSDGKTQDVVIDIPWLLLGGMTVLLPLLAIVVAGVFTRSRLPLVRRIAQ